MLWWSRPRLRGWAIEPSGLRGSTRGPLLEEKLRHPEPVGLALVDPVEELGNAVDFGHRTGPWGTAEDSL
jgi:hypothetical protein